MNKWGASAPCLNWDVGDDWFKQWSAVFKSEKNWQKMSLLAQLVPIIFLANIQNRCKLCSGKVVINHFIKIY